MALRTPLALGILSLAISNCAPRLAMLEAPTAVEAGREFAVTVHAHDVLSLANGTVGCVVQLPIGVALTGAVPVPHVDPGLVRRDSPSLLAVFTPEAGRYLASVDADVAASFGALALLLQAGPAWTAPIDVKVALVGRILQPTPGAWTVSDPAGVTNFASIGGANARSIAIVATPAPFERLASGLPATARALATGDLDGDGRDDLLAVDPSASPPRLVTALARSGPWSIVPSAAAVNPGAYSAVLGDFNGDGALDAVVHAQLWFGNGAGAFAPGPLLPSGISAYDAVGDVDADGVADVVCSSSGAAFVFRCNGNGTFANWSTGLPTYPQIVGRPVLQDVTGDGRADLVLARTTLSFASSVTVHASNGAGGWNASVPFVPAGTPLQVAVGDLTGDGAADIVVGLEAGQLADVWQHQGGNAWVRAPLPPIPAQAVLDFVLLDHDRDGLVDIAAIERIGAHSTGWTRMRLVRNGGPAGFADVPDAGLTAIGSRSLKLFGADVDGDTFPDLATNHPELVFCNTRVGRSPYGAGCAGAGHAPRLDTNGPPLLGNGSFALQLHDGVANGAGLLWLGFSKRFAFGLPQLPFALGSLGAPGCSVLAEQIAVRLVLHDGQGLAAMPLPLPNDPSLHRLLLFCQGAALVPSANALGALFTVGLAMRLD